MAHLEIEVRALFVAYKTCILFGPRQGSSDHALLGLCLPCSQPCASLRCCCCWGYAGL